MSAIDQNSSEEDLEDGEIKDEILEDISECSLSDVLSTEQDLKDNSDVEVLREEALKSLRDDDIIPEEELYRLEALKSLLNNMELSEKLSSKEVPKKKRKRRKKIKHKLSSKYLKIENSMSNELELRLKSSDFQVSVAQMDNAVPEVNFLNKENRIVSLVNAKRRSWYPKTDFALRSTCLNESTTRIKEEPQKLKGGNPTISVPKILSVVNQDIRPSTNQPVPMKRPVNRCVKLNHCTKAVTPIITPMSRPNFSFPPSSVGVKRFKRVTKHQIRKYNTTTPQVNRFSLRNVQKGMYKIVNAHNVLKKSTNSPVRMTEKPNSQLKSKYSINHLKDRLPRLKTELIIEFDGEESGKEEEFIVAPVGEQSSKTESPKIVHTRTKIQLEDNAASSLGASEEENFFNYSDNPLSPMAQCESKTKFIDVPYACQKKSRFSNAKDDWAVHNSKINPSEASQTSYCDTSDDEGTSEKELHEVDETEVENPARGTFYEGMNSKEGTIRFSHVENVKVPNEKAKSEIQIVESEPEIEVLDFEPEVQIIKSEPEMQTEESESEIEVLDFKPEIQIIKSNPEIQAEESEPEIQVLDFKPEIQAEESESEIQVLDFTPEIQAEESESEIQVLDFTPEIQAEESEPEIQVLDFRPEIQVVKSEPEIQVVKSEPEIGVIPFKPEIQVIKSEPEIRFEEFDSEIQNQIDDFEFESELKKTAEMVKTEMEVGSDSEISEKYEFNTLVALGEAEANLIEIRARLLFRLDELEETFKRNAGEKEKLNRMLRKLLSLKSMIFKFEDKIREHQSTLSVHSNALQSLFRDVIAQTDTCDKLKDTCMRAGSETMGPLYKPPDMYENIIREKREAIDFSQYVPSNFQ